METRTPSMFQPALRYACVAGILGIVVTCLGCSQSSLRDLSMFRSSEKTESDFEEQLASNESVPLTIWHDSFETAQQASRETGKPILVDFTGSDWCSWCIKLKQDVFETSKFKAWARDNVVLLELDYPKRSIQSMAMREQNRMLAERYKVESYPTVLLLDSEGEVLGKLGYMKNPTAWIASAQPMISQSVSTTTYR